LRNVSYPKATGIKHRRHTTYLVALKTHTGDVSFFKQGAMISSFSEFVVN